MKEDDNYCGFLCQDVIDRQTEILDEIKDFSNYNPEFAQEMIDKIINLSIKYKDIRFIVAGEPKK
jgi:DNA-directed RNA polymerase subunit F